MPTVIRIVPPLGNLETFPDTKNGLTRARTRAQTIADTTGLRVHMERVEFQQPTKRKAAAGKRKRRGLGRIQIVRTHPLPAFKVGARVSVRRSHSAKTYRGQVGTVEKVARFGKYRVKLDKGRTVVVDHADLIPAEGGAP